MQYERFAGNATNAYNATITFDKISKQVDITVWDNNLDFCASYDGEAAHFEGDIEVPSSSTLMVPLACQAIKVRNHTAGQTARYEIIAWYIPTEYA
jgi:hypothetical protein